MVASKGSCRKVIVVVEVLVAQRQSINRWAIKMLEGMLDKIRVTMISEAGGELADDGREFLGFAEKQAAPVGGDITTIKRGENLAGTEGGEIQVS